MRENEGERKKHLALSRSQTRSLLTIHKILSIRAMEIVQLTVTKAAVCAFSFSLTSFQTHVLHTLRSWAQASGQ